MRIVACLLCLGFWPFGQGTPVPAQAWAAQELMQRNWEQVPNGVELSSPWPWGRTWPVARLSAKSGDVDLIVLAGASRSTLAYGPGHLAASALPGEPGNSVIAGYRDTHFSFLKDVAVGENLTVETADGFLHVYTVVDLGVIDSRRGSLQLDTDGAMLSLVTGYPFDDTPDNDAPAMRYIVTARKVL
jgi:sortase A